jgi:hypothetical protein
MFKARLCPGTLGAFVYHQEWITAGGNVKAALLEGPGKIEQIDALQDKGGIDVMLVKVTLQLVYPEIKFRFRRI